MKKILYLFLVFSLAVSCRNNHKEKNRDGNNISKQAITAAEDYAKGLLKKPTRWVTDQGIIVVSDSLSKYLIDPSKVVTGDFEGDTLKDAIIPLYLFRGREQDITINLFLVNNEGKLMIVRAMQDNMKVLSVLKRVIYIELPVLNSDEEKRDTRGKTEVKEFLFESDSLRRYSSATDTVR